MNCGVVIMMGTRLITEVNAAMGYISTCMGDCLSSRPSFVTRNVSDLEVVFVARLP